MKSAMELLFYFFIYLFINIFIFVISPGLMRRHTGGLANEVFTTSNLTGFSKQQLSGLKTTNCN